MTLPVVLFVRAILGSCLMIESMPKSPLNVDLEIVSVGVASITLLILVSFSSKTIERYETVITAKSVEIIHQIRASLLTYWGLTTSLSIGVNWFPSKIGHCVCCRGRRNWFIIRCILIARSFYFTAVLSVFQINFILVFVSLTHDFVDSTKGSVSWLRFFIIGTSAISEILFVFLSLSLLFEVAHLISLTRVIKLRARDRVKTILGQKISLSFGGHSSKGRHWRFAKIQGRRLSISRLHNKLYYDSKIKL